MTVLDWRDKTHYAHTATGAPALRPCRRCRRRTPLRDDTGRPCHKVCAEAEIDAKARAS